MIQTFMADPFPHDQSLCEQGGYPVQGLSGESDCPECGVSIASSHHRHRIGLPWQHAHTPPRWLRTQALLMFRPLYAFRVMAVEPTPRTARLFALATLPLLAATWIVWSMGYDIHVRWDVFAVAMVAVVALSFVEAAGVAFFSKRHGYRIPRSFAEQLAWYAMAGWFPAAAVMPLIFSWRFERWLVRIWPRETLGDLDIVREYLIIMLIGGLSILWFETLVWIGVKQARYANFSHRKMATDEHR